MKKSSLYELITALEYGTHLHIGVLFFGRWGNERLLLPRAHTIHISPICGAMKGLPGGERRCFRCRNTALQKAMQTGEPFGGFCINGVYEYTHPVKVGEEIACVIFVGNIRAERQSKGQMRRLSRFPTLLSTMEEDFSMARCQTLGFLIEEYVRTFLAEPSSKKADPLIENIQQYLGENLENDLDLSAVATLFHYHPKYLGRLFKAECGMSMRAYLNLQRMERAKQWLLGTEESVGTIAARAGYNQVAYFNRVFKALFGATPTEYRQLYK